MAGASGMEADGFGAGTAYRRATGKQAPIRGLLFDKDGTLFDFHRTWSGWAEGVIHELADGQPERVRRLAEAIGFDLERRRFRKSSPAVAGTLEAIVAAMLPALAEMRRADLHAYLVRRAAEAEPVEAAPLGPLLDRLKAHGFALGLATNDAEAAARAQLVRTGALGRFDFVAGYDSGFGSKPEPGMHRAFCQAAGLQPGAVAMIGDSPHDLRPARALGMVAVAVLTGPLEAEDLAAEADAVLGDIGHLPGWLGISGS